ncbi:MAG: type IV pilus biogenesis/stability protein PilW [Polyangiales bacterium]
MRRIPLWVWWCTSLCVLASTASAQEAGSAHRPSAGESTSVDQARQLFAEGLKFVELEDWAQAEDRFRRVLALRSSHVVAYNLASALVHLGRIVESSELLRAIVRDATAEAATREAATQLLSEIEPRIGSLTIRVSGDAPGASLKLDDKQLELTGSVQTVSVDPGEHHVALVRDGAELTGKSAQVGGDAPLQVELTLELSPPPAPEAAARAAGAPDATRRHAPAAATAAETDRAEPGPQQHSSSVLASPWLWAGAGAVVAATIVTIVLLAPASAGPTLTGDTNPPVIHGRVSMP